MTRLIKLLICLALVFLGFSIHRGFYNTDKPEWLEKIWKVETEVETDTNTDSMPLTDNYNSDKDLYINDILSDGYNTYDITVGEITGTDMYEFYYDEIMFTIFYKSYVPYEHKEGWSFYATKRDGTTYVIEGVIKRNKLHWTTYLKIQEMCLDVKKKWEAAIESHSNHIETQLIRMDGEIKKSDMMVNELSPERRKEIMDVLLDQLDMHTIINEIN